MNVIVLPDAAMIVIPLIEKNGHTYLSPSNFSRYDNMDICEGRMSYENIVTPYLSSEVPSGIRGRLFLLANVLDRADAAIIIGKRPKNRAKMYSALNDLILFGGNACNNAHSLEVKMVQDLKIPILKLAYPTNQSEIIDLIEKTNSFLKNLNDIPGTVNADNVGADLKPKSVKCPIRDVEKIFNKSA